jgi:RNA polymerase sigma-70 factor (ECF subfamily)
MSNTVDGLRTTAAADATAAVSDEVLVARIRAGDGQACAALVQQHGGRMLAVARRFLRSEEDRADAVQDAFLAAFRALPTFQGNAALATWLHRIVVNACLMRLRARARRRQVPLDDLLPAGADPDHTARGWEAPAERGLTREETRAQVRACIDRLPEGYRVVLLLRDIEELDTDQTARRLGMSTGAVKSRLHRARSALRTLLEPLIISDCCLAAV